MLFPSSIIASPKPKSSKFPVPVTASSSQVFADRLQLWREEKYTMPFQLAQQLSTSRPLSDPSLEQKLRTTAKLLLF